MKSPIRMVILALVASVTQVRPAKAGEFVGPFPSWTNAKRDYNARGDGSADDTHALQAALDDLGKPGHSHVLFLPAGVYRITATLELDARIDIGFLGEDPQKTVIRWEGPAGAAMFHYNGVAYSRFGRIAWDGQSKAGTAVDQAWDGKHNYADTGNEHADEVFRDVGVGLRVGRLNYMGSEGSVLRCRFVRCSQAGLSVQNFNALDWWLWNCTFDSCRIGVTNTMGAGNYHVYNSLFLHSAESDMSIGNTEFFSVRGNTSIGSKAFFVAGAIGACGMVTLQANTIVDPTAPTPIRIGDLGPLLLMDNAVYTSGAPAVSLQPLAAVLAIGNRFSVARAIAGGGRRMEIDSTVVKPAASGPHPPQMPGTDPNLRRVTLDLPAGSDSTIIQAAIVSASRKIGQRAVVHLPAGEYSIDRTIVIPIESDIQLVGDGGATHLRWAGAGAGPVVRIEGPSKAILRDLTVDGGRTADGILCVNCDQPNGRVFGEGVMTRTCSATGFAVNGLAHTVVELHDFGHDGNTLGVLAEGPVSGPAAKVDIFGGASSNNQLSYRVDRGGSLLAEDTWYEGSPPGFMNCTGAGTFTLNGATVATSDPNHGGVQGPYEAVHVDGFKGRLTFLTTIFSTRIALHGQSPSTRLLALGVLGNGPNYYLDDSSNAAAALLDSFRYTPGGGATSIPDEGHVDLAFLRAMLEQVRSERPRSLNALPAGTTDLRLFRVIVLSCKNGIMLEK